MFLRHQIREETWDSLELFLHEISNPRQVDGVNITGQKLAIRGTATVAESGNGVSFALLTGVGLAGDGHILYLDKPELVLNPESKLPVKVGPLSDVMKLRGGGEAGESGGVAVNAST